MRILLDTNVVIHRENKRVSNYSGSVKIYAQKDLQAPAE